MTISRSSNFETNPGTPRLTKPPYLSQSGYYMGSLFWEQATKLPIDKRVIYPVFSLYEDRPPLICARKTFVEIGDPTGYEWALKYLGDWSHFLRLLDTPWFHEAYEVWSNELREKQTAEALSVIRKIALDSENKQQLPAAKYIAGRDWEKPARGRPSANEVQGELKKAIRHIEAEREDLERIKQLKVVK